MRRYDECNSFIRHYQKHHEWTNFRSDCWHILYSHRAPCGFLPEAPWSCFLCRAVSSFLIILISKSGAMTSFSGFLCCCWLSTCSLMDVAGLREKLAPPNILLKTWTATINPIVISSMYLMEQNFLHNVLDLIFVLFVCCHQSVLPILPACNKKKDQYIKCGLFLILSLQLCAHWHANKVMSTNKASE